MNKSELKSIQNICRKSKENVNNKIKYSSAVSTYMKSEDIDSDFISLILDGIFIDQGVNFVENFMDLDTSKRITVWNTLKNNNEIIEGKNGFCLLCGLFASSLYEKRLEDLAAPIMTAFANNGATLLNIKDGNQIVDVTLKDFFIDALPLDITYPKWRTYKITSKTAEEIIGILECYVQAEQKRLKGKKTPELEHLKAWIVQGKRNKKRLIEDEKIAEITCDSRFTELQELASYYKDLENQYNDIVVKLWKASESIETLESKLAKSTVRITESKRIISKYEEKIKKQEEQLKHYTNALSESEDLNKSFGTVKKDSEQAMLKDIANALHNIYEDYSVTKYETMDEELGEIYRDHLTSMFRILNEKGVVIK